MTTPAPLVLKLGGTLLDDDATVLAVWQQVRTLAATRPVVLVHGGGAQATELAARLGHAPRIVHGRRITSDLDLDIAQWTFRGALSTRLVAAAHRVGVRAVGVSGVDGGTLRVHRRPPRLVDGEWVDFGWVGDVDGVEPSLLQALCAAGLVPVVAPLGVDGEGRVFNVNADTVAVAVAQALGAEELRFVTEAGGLRRDPADAATHLATCDADTVARGVTEGWITDGMRVKLDTALGACAAGIRHVAIVPPDGLTRPDLGTRVLASEPSATAA